jgi:uncharacterized protein (DUF1778 family)
MTTDTGPPTGRRRTYVFPGRQKRLSIRVTDDEDTEIADAANQLGLTPTGFCAHSALDAARNLHTGTTERMEHETLANLQAELLQARITLNQLRAELARHHDTDDRATAERDEIIARAALSMTGLDAIISRVHHRLGKR